MATEAGPGSATTNTRPAAAPAAVRWGAWALARWVAWLGAVTVVFLVAGGLAFLVKSGVLNLALDVSLPLLLWAAAASISMISARTGGPKVPCPPWRGTVPC